MLDSHRHTYNKQRKVPNSKQQPFCCEVPALSTLPTCFNKIYYNCVGQINKQNGIFVLCEEKEKKIDFILGGRRSQAVSVIYNICGMNVNLSRQ